MEKKKIRFKLTYEVDGEISPESWKKAQDKIMESVMGVILSEDTDGTDDWALLCEECEVLDGKETD